MAIDQTELDDLIAREIAEAQSVMWGDHDLGDRIDANGYETDNPQGTLADRRTRAVVAYHCALPEGTWCPTRLRRQDQVILIGAVQCVVAMPARGREYFLGYAPAHYGPRLVRFKWDLVTARLPSDPGDPGMPIAGNTAASFAPLSDVPDDEFFAELEEPVTNAKRKLMQLARRLLIRQVALWRFLQSARWLSTLAMVLGAGLIMLLTGNVVAALVTVLLTSVLYAFWSRLVGDT